MNTRIASIALITTLLSTMAASAQPSDVSAPLTHRFIDPVNGLSLDEAIARAIEQEPSLREARSQIDVAQGMRLQASLRPNPSVSFERREEPGGSDNLTMVRVEWPLDLFRRRGRVAVADHEVAIVRLAVADRQRLLTADVRARYGDLAANARDLALFDELVTTTRKQHELLQSRVDEGASPPLERDLLDVELRRLQAERLLQAGRTEAAAFELKRVLGMKADAQLTVRDKLDVLVQSESSVGPDARDTSSAVDQRADVREAAARVDAAEAKIDRAQAQGRFDVSVSANYMRMDSGFPQRGFTPGGTLAPIRGQFHYVSAGAMLTIPVLNRNQGEVAAARAERTGTTAGHQAARLAAEVEIAAAGARDDHARQAVKMYSDGARTLARQNFTVVAQSFELGRVTVFDVLAEQRRYLEVERAFTDALRAAYEANMALKRARGEMR